MNVERVLSFIAPYVRNKTITYDEFEKVFNFLENKEKYEVVEILHQNTIELVDGHSELGGMAEELLFLDAPISTIKFESSAEKETIYRTKITQSNHVLCSLIQEGNRQAEHDICVKNENLVRKYAYAYKKYMNNHLELEDLMQVGFMGLIKAAKKFDLSMDNEFSTYAVWWIKQAILREIMDNGYVVRIPVHIMEKIHKIHSLEIEYGYQGYSSKDRIKAISKEMGISEQKTEEYMWLEQNYITYASLDVPISEDGETELGSMVEDHRHPSLEDIVFRQELTSELERILTSLKPRDAEVIQLRYGLIDGREYTLEEIGKQYGLTRERIRQIEERTLRKLRHPSKTKLIKDFLE